MSTDSPAPEKASPTSTDTERTWHDLTAFQRDCLEAIARLECDGVEVYGLAIKAELERRYGSEINHGRLYPNLDELTAAGFVAKGTIDQRTNAYALTPAADAMLRERTRQLADAAGLGVREAAGGDD